MAKREWIGGVLASPGLVTDGGEPYRPDLIVWAMIDGPILDMHALEQPQAGSDGREVRDAFVERFGLALENPAHTPSRVRVASPDLAAALRSAYGDRCKIFCGPTPELDLLAVEFDKSMQGLESRSDRTYFGEGVSLAALSSLFRAVARLYRAKLWEVVPNDRSLLSVTIPALEVDGRVACVIGQMGESRGVLLFESLSGYEENLEAALARADGEKLPPPRHFCMTFDAKRDAHPALRAEIKKHQLEIAGDDAYPFLAFIEPDLTSRAASPKDVTIAEALAHALVTICETPEPLARAFTIGEPYERTLEVDTHEGPVEVIVRAVAQFGSPDVEDESDEDDPLEALEDLAAEATEDGVVIDIETRHAIEEPIFEAFAESAEAKGLPAIEYAPLFLDLLATYRMETLATMHAEDLVDVVFSVIPRTVTIPASKAKAIVKELRAFFLFVGQRFALDCAEACVMLLEGNAAKRLEEALGNRHLFGPAKTVMMAGLDAGYAVNTREGLEAWMHELERRPNATVGAAKTKNKAGRRRR